MSTAKLSIGAPTWPSAITCGCGPTYDVSRPAFRHSMWLVTSGVRSTQRRHTCLNTSTGWVHLCDRHTMACRPERLHIDAVAGLVRGTVGLRSRLRRALCHVQECDALLTHLETSARTAVRTCAHATAPLRHMRCDVGCHCQDDSHSSQVRASLAGLRNAWNTVDLECNAVK